MTYEEKIQFIEKHCSNPDHMKRISNTFGVVLQISEAEKPLSPKDLAVFTFLVTDNLLNVLLKRRPSPEQFEPIPQIMDSVLDAVSVVLGEAPTILEKVQP